MCQDQIEVLNTRLEAAQKDKEKALKEKDVVQARINDMLLQAAADAERRERDRDRDRDRDRRHRKDRAEKGSGARAAAQAEAPPITPQTATSCSSGQVSKEADPPKKQQPAKDSEKRKDQKQARSRQASVTSNKIPSATASRQASTCSNMSSKRQKTP